MTVTFGESYEEASGVVLPAAELASIGSWIAGFIPEPSAANGGMRMAARWWAYYVGCVFPLSVANPNPSDATAGKIPHGMLGHGWSADELPSRNLDQVDEWWNDAPLANVGFATRASGVLILDVDPRHEGWTNLRRWADERAVDLSQVPRSESPRADGGAHLWWRVPDGATYPHGPLVRGVDRPWQVPVPPSMRYLVVDNESRDPSRRYGFSPYRWRAGDPRALPVAPECLLGDGEPQAAQTTNGDSIAVALGERIGSDTADLLITEGVPVGQQSYTFKRIACSMVSRGFSDEIIVRSLCASAEASPVGDPRDPWTLSDIVAMVHHARRYIEGERAREGAQNVAYAANLAEKVGLN